MIRDGALTYASSTLRWYEDEFENITLNAFTIAAVMTVFSYQATAIIFDIVLGCKTKWMTSISRFHILLITRKATPLVIFNNLLRQDWLTRWYYRGDLPSSTHIAREKERVKLGTGLALLFLLAVAPLVNTASVVLTLEREKTLSFDEAGFGGVSFGVKPGLAITTEERMSELCVRLPVRFRPGDTALAEFSLCKLPWTGRLERRSEGRVSISLADGHQVLISVQLGEYSVELYKTAYLQANSAIWVLRPNISSESVAELVDLGMGYVSEECGVSVGIEPVDTYIVFNEPGRQNIMAKRVPCDIQGDTRAKSARILALVERHLTLIESDLLEVAVKPVELTAAEFFRGANMAFIRRRQLYIGMSLWCVIAAVVTVLRVATALLWNNDISDGIESIVKERLGVSCCSSFLKVEERKIVYNNKYQSGNLAHYGLAKDHWPVVGEFEGGTVGAFNLSKDFDGDSGNGDDYSFGGLRISTNI